jgi:hypothetical protein
MEKLNGREIMKKKARGSSTRFPSSSAVQRTPASSSAFHPSSSLQTLRVNRVTSAHEHDAVPAQTQDRNSLMAIGLTLCLKCQLALERFWIFLGYQETYL